MAVALAFVLIYLVLAALYESFILPLIIMITMPLAFGGASIGLFITGHNFSLLYLLPSSYFLVWWGKMLFYS